MGSIFHEPVDRKGDPLPKLPQRLAALRVLPRFLSMVWATGPGLMIAVVLCRLGSALTPVALLLVGKLIIDTVVLNIGATNPDWSRLLVLVSLEFLIAVISEATARAISYFDALLGDRVGNRIATQVMRHASELSLEQLEDPDFRDKLDRTRRHAAGRVLLLEEVMKTGQHLVTLLSLVGALIAFSPLLLGVLVMAVLPSFLGETRHVGMSYSFVFRWTKERREIEYFQYIASNLPAAKEVKLFNLTEYLIGRYGRLARQYLEEVRRLAARRALSGGILSTLSSAAYYMGALVVIRQAVLGTITLGTLTMLLGVLNRSRQLLQGLLLSLARQYEQCLYLKDLFDFIDVQPAVASQPAGRSVARPLTQGVVFEDVSFRYAGQSSWAVRNLSFSVSSRENVALVGPNGSGKTTMVKLLTRLYDPTEGRILLDGVDIREYDPKSLRSVMGVIFQDFVRYDLTVRENIAVGWIEQLWDEHRVQTAAQQSGAHPVITGLERGYDQVLGRRFDDGVELSGGEWQKIALARAHMRNAEVLILDEPTAALDAAAEYAVFQRFTDLMTDRLAILISHRFSTVRKADRILVLERGMLTESGSHEELLAIGGRYSELFHLQAEGYR